MASALISITETSSGTALKLSASKIVQFEASGSGALITYVDQDSHATNIIVTQSVSTLTAAALNTFPVTLTNAAATVVYLNADYIGRVVTTGSGATIYYDQKKTAFQPVVVTETPAAIQTLVNDLITDITFDDITVTDPITYSTATGITAFAGGGQASATALTEEFNNITVCATAGDSVKLPAATAGFSITVKNSGATALDIFPASGDSINALAVNLAVRIQPGSMVTFKAITAVIWESSTDASITITAPTTVSGGLEIKATDSAGNFVTTVTNASQAAARTYTIPDAGANANFVMTEGAQTVNGVKTFGGQTVHAAGSVSAPGLVIGANDNGQYEISSTQQGFSIGNALVGGYNASGLFTGTIAEQVAAAGVAVDSTLLKDGLVFNKPTPVAINVTATATAAEIVSGCITSTSAAAVAITTPTATAIAALIGAVRGTSFDFAIDNSAGANTVTLTLDASIAVVTPALTGGDTLTVSTANAIGIFRLYFTSGTTAKIFRIG